MSFARGEAGEFSETLLGMSGDQSEGRFLLGGIRAVHRIDEDIGIEKTPADHGSVAAEFSPDEFHALGVARRLLEALDHRIDRGLGVRDRIGQQLANQGIQTGSSRPGIAASASEQLVVDGEGDLRHVHRVCAHGLFVYPVKKDALAV